VAVLEGDASVSQELLAAQVDHVLFTGGPEIGKKIMAAAAERLIPVTLELGGKSPVIIAGDGDVAVAARRVAWTKLLNSGQTCIAPDYVLVDEKLAEQFVAELTATVETFQQGEPAAQRIVSPRQLERIAGLLTGAGGTVVLGGGVDRDAQAIEPTVIVSPDPAAPLMTEEIFGPVLPVLPVASATPAWARTTASGDSRRSAIARPCCPSPPGLTRHCSTRHIPRRRRRSCAASSRARREGLGLGPR
jgi:aldehyde dehydrogenase (NAD+)